MVELPDYGNWIRKGRIAVFSLITLLFIMLSALLFIHLLFLLFLLPAILFGYIAFIISLTYYRFSPSGGDYQNKVHNLILDRVDASGRILDIGCGSGALAIKTAKKNRDAEITGVDYWGKDWEYGLDQCARNAKLEKIKNVNFQKGTASALDFEDGAFDTVVSCLTFHEVKDTERKEKCISESLRILKPGGDFVFIDLFDDKRYYPDHKALRKTLKKGSGKIIENKRIGELLDFPYPLNNGRSLKYARLISGKKTKQAHRKSKGT